MPIPLAERVAVVEQRLDNHEGNNKRLEKSVSELTETLKETNKALAAIQLSQAFLSGQRKGAYAVVCVISSAFGAAITMAVEYFRK